jgi:hypothetical protein
VEELSNEREFVSNFQMQAGRWDDEMEHPSL